MSMRIVVVGDLAEGRTADLLAAGFARAYPDAQIEGYPEALAQTWVDLGDPDHLAGVDLIVWSKSRALAVRFDQRAMLTAAEQTGTRVVAYHLDRWWGLARESEISDDPFFRAPLVVTTDGGNDDLWERAGVQHAWVPPPAPDSLVTLTGRPNPRLSGKAVFVGSWQRYAHPEWRYRTALIKRLKRRFSSRLVTFPGPDGQRVTGQPLADIVASAAVVIGDSALPGSGRYWSDRVPITLGLGGVLVHPEVEGMDAYFQSGVHYLGAPIEDPDALGDVVAEVLAGKIDTAPLREAGRAAVQAGHTYTGAARRIVELSGYLENSEKPRGVSPSGESDDSSSEDSSSSSSGSSSRVPSRSTPSPSRSGRAALAALPPGIVSL